MKTPLLFLAAAMVVAACTSRQQSGEEIEIILPSEDRNDTNFYDAVKSVEVIDLEVDSNYFYIEDADLRVSPNYYYFVNNRAPYLACYDKATGKVQFSRTIAGRSRAECNYIYNSFVMGDTIVVNDVGLLKMYDHCGKFIGTLNDTALWTDYLLPFGDGYIACDFDGSVYNSDDKCLTLFDKNFNAGETYFELPDGYKAFAHHHISNTSPNIYIFNDTLRFCVQNSFNLHLFPGGKTYRFVPSNPMPESVKAKSMDLDFSSKCVEQGYAMNVRNLVENQDFIMFEYEMSIKLYNVLFSKSDNKVYGWGGYVEDIRTPFDIWKILIGCSDILYSDGKYFYARLSKEEIDGLDEFEEIFTDQQRAVYDTMQARLARNADNEFEYFYLKILMAKE